MSAETPCDCWGESSLGFPGSIWMLLAEVWTCSGVALQSKEAETTVNLGGVEFSLV